MRWITRERPKIDRLACPWLIKRFIDPEAEIIYVPLRDVIPKAKEFDAIPFDIPDVEFTHYQDKCTFDYFLEKYKLDDPALQIIALIVRGADTDAHHLSTQSSGLWAISAGLAFNYKDDLELLVQATVIYDALYSWAKHLQDLRHTQNPTDHILHEVYNKYLKLKKNEKKTPEWVRDFKEIIQDQIDLNLSLGLKEISSELKVHPAYLSREFARHFDNLSFGDYIRKLRIEKALKLIEETDYSLSEISYLTGFSDQSHFTRIFRKQLGISPSSHRKLLKGKKNTKG